MRRRVDAGPVNQNERTSSTVVVAISPEFMDFYHPHTCRYNVRTLLLLVVVRVRVLGFGV